MTLGEQAEKRCTMILTQPSAPKWGVMQPFPEEKTTLPYFPLEDLPPSLRDFVMAVAESTQTNPDMASVVALGTLAVCNQRKFHVWNNYYEPLSLYTVLIAEPGERKSAVMAHFTRHLQEFQKLENNRRRDHINRYEIKKELLENQIRTLKESPKGPPDIEARLLKKIQELHDLPVVKPLRLFCEDCSPEALVALLEKNQGLMSVISAEGGIFDIISGRYSGKPNLDVFLKGHTGEEILVDRKNSGNHTVSNPALSFVLAIQPEVLQDIMHNPVLNGRGLLARFLYSSPESFIGKRDYESLPVPQHIDDTFQQLIHTLLAVPVPETPVTLTLSTGARERMKTYFCQIETRFAQETTLKNWLAKHVGSIHRIAGNLHLAGRQDESLVISTETMESAIRIGEYFLGHAQFCFLSALGEGELAKTKEVLEVIHKLSATKVPTRRDVFRGGGSRGLKIMKDMLPYLDVLEEQGYIQQIRCALTPNSKPCDLILLHPEYRG